MANAVKGETALKLKDGREFILALDMEAMLTIEDTTGTPLPKVMLRAQEGFMTAIAAIAQAAFSRHHPDVTRVEVLDMLRSDEKAVHDALSAATAVAFPDQVEGSGEVGKARKRPAGKTSGRNGAKRG